ncbi:hypothetical protein L3Q82_003780 [Scortum barcoo]|uniref:Uncharacterized protein n=1 Tax=Scortum barcoo TaxID=214431 RepID=A0ACB8XAH8_9TELE|nr:hypothetical protein L3Q82_003780 [Scortum barcoo]
MVGPSQPVVALVDDDVILPCYLETAVDVVSRAVEWARADLNPRFVHVRRDGVELLIDQNPSYIGRTSISIEQLKRGDISLKLSKIRLSDEGKYKCYIPELNRASTVQLVVEPEVLWLDGEGNLLSAGPPETVRGPDDLYTVSSRVTVEKRHSNRFTCRVQQKNINQTREAHIHVADNFFMVPSCVVVIVSLSLVACFMSILTAVIVWKFKRNKINAHLKDETEPGKKEKGKTFSKNKKMKSTSEGKVEEQLMATSEGVDSCTEDTNLHGRSLLTKDNLNEVLTKLEGQKTDLNNQRKELNSLLQDVKAKLEKNKKKLENAPALNREKKQKKQKQTKQELEKEEKQLEGLLENTEKLLKTTDDLITFHSCNNE